MKAHPSPAPVAASWLAISAAVTPLAVSLAANITWGVSTGSAILVVAGVVTPLLLVLAIERWRVMPPATGLQWWVRTLAMSGVVVVVAGWSWLHATALLLAEVAALHPGQPTSATDSALRVVEVALCVLAPLAVDGLAVLSVLALDVTGRAGLVDVDEPVTDGMPVEGVEVQGVSDTPARTHGQPARTPSDSPPGQRADTPVRHPVGTPVQGVSDSPVSSQSDCPARRLSAVPTPGPDDPVDDLRQWAEQLGEKPSGSQVRKRYSIGHDRAKRMLAALDAPAEASPEGTKPTEPGDQAGREPARSRLRAEGALTS